MICFRCDGFSAEPYDRGHCNNQRNYNNIGDEGSLNSPAIQQVRIVAAPVSPPWLTWVVS